MIKGIAMLGMLPAVGSYQTFKIILAAEAGHPSHLHQQPMLSSFIHHVYFYHHWFFGCNKEV